MCDNSPSETVIKIQPVAVRSAHPRWYVSMKCRQTPHTFDAEQNRHNNNNNGHNMMKKTYTKVCKFVCFRR